MQFSHERDHVWNVLDYVAADDFIKLRHCEGIWKSAEIVNDVSLGLRIRVEAYGAWILVLTAPNVKDFGPVVDYRRSCIEERHVRLLVL